MSQLIIGLGNYSRTGKDTLADEIVAQLNVSYVVAKKAPFAWKLKEVCHDLYGWAGLREPEFYDTSEGAPLRDVVLPEIGKTPVQIWVAMGTPAVRDNVYQGTWIDYVLRTYERYGVLVIPDVRFQNEVDAIRSRHGLLIRVTRPGVSPRNTIADQSLASGRWWDLEVVNDGTLDELAEKGQQIAMAANIIRAEYRKLANLRRVPQAPVTPQPPLRKDCMRPNCQTCNREI